MSLLTNHIRRWALLTPDTVAIRCQGHDDITYRELLPMMQRGDTLPIPLMGDRWDGDYRLYTTGTTGARKGVAVSHHAMMANSRNLIMGQRYPEHVIFIITGDMEHLGCWSKIFPTLLQGGTVIILPNGMKDVDAFFAAVNTAPATLRQPATARVATFLVPANIRILLLTDAQRLAASAARIEFIETGGAPMAHADMLRLCQLLPQARLYNTYASTETGIVATYNYNDGECIEGCVGHPLPLSAIHITPEGRIACQGATLMTGYLPDIVPPADGVFVTNDNGHFDAQGRLHIQGRADDIMNIGGYKVSPVEIESAAMSHPKVKDCLCRPFQHPILGQAPELLVVTTDGTPPDRRALARHIAQQLPQYKVPLRYTLTDNIPRNRNGKIVRG